MTYADPHTLPPEHDPTPGWGQSLSNGAAGLALLHIAYARAGIGDWLTAHQWIKAMTRSPVAADPITSLYQGAPAVAFVVRAAAQPAYAPVLATLDRHIAEITHRRLQRAHARIDRGELPELREFDLINGLTGIGVYLLVASQTDLLHDVLAYLVRLTGTITVNGHATPGWWTAHGPSGRPHPQWPGGHANLGLAHGITGPLSLLATTRIHGITVPGQAEAIDQIDGMLGRWRCGTQTRPWWPGTISARAWTTGTVDHPGPQRPSWCYGTPGLARARQLAALALNLPERRTRAERALLSCVTDDSQLGQLGDDSLCHGWAGLVHTTARAAADAGPDSELAREVPRLQRRWRQHRTHSRPKPSDPDGMLLGHAGITLVRHSIEHAVPLVDWDACLLTTSPTQTIEGTG